MERKTCVWLHSKIFHQSILSAVWNTVDTCLALVLCHHLVGQVKQRDDSILGHTFPHERQRVASPLDIEWGDHLCRGHRLYLELESTAAFPIQSFSSCKDTADTVLERKCNQRRKILIWIKWCYCALNKYTKYLKRHHNFILFYLHLVDPSTFLA